MQKTQKMQKMQKMKLNANKSFSHFDFLFPLFQQESTTDKESPEKIGNKSVSSSESFKRLPKKRKFDLSDFETTETNKISVTGTNPHSSTTTTTTTTNIKSNIVV